jgi:hypothetical protein
MGWRARQKYASILRRSSRRQRARGRTVRVISSVAHPATEKHGASCPVLRAARRPPCISGGETRCHKRTICGIRRDGGCTTTEGGRPYVPRSTLGPAIGWPVDPRVRYQAKVRGGIRGIILPRRSARRRQCTFAPLLRKEPLRAPRAALVDAIRRASVAPDAAVSGSEIFRLCATAAQVNDRGIEHGNTISSRGGGRLIGKDVGCSTSSYGAT